MTDLEIFRAEKDRFFASHPQSPLTPEQQRNFRGLSYFPENTGLRLEVTVDKIPQQEQVTMQTSTGGTQTYTRFGIFTFNVDGQEAALTLYSGEHGYFLPFVDSLAGAETYGAGRYLEPEAVEGGKYVVDFNLAYNPYCAYNDLYSCPLTPWENRLKVPIWAGEKAFEGEGHQ